MKPYKYATKCNKITNASVKLNMNVSKILYIEFDEDVFQYLRRQDLYNEPCIIYNCWFKTSPTYLTFRRTYLLITTLKWIS